MNYNGCTVVETTYETFAFASPFRCPCFSFRLRGRTTGSLDASTAFQVSAQLSVPVPAAPATLRPKCRSAAAGKHRPGASTAAGCNGGRSQADQGRYSLWDSSSEQARFCHQPLRAEFRVCRRPWISAWDRSQRSLHAENLSSPLRPRWLWDVFQLGRSRGAGQARGILDADRRASPSCRALA